MRAHQEAARQHDEWEELLRNALHDMKKITLAEASERLGIPMYWLDKGVQTRLGLVLRALGFQRQRETTGPRGYFWERYDAN